MGLDETTKQLIKMMVPILEQADSQINCHDFTKFLSTIITLHTGSVTMYHNRYCTIIAKNRPSPLQRTDIQAVAGEGRFFLPMIVHQ